MSYDIAQALIEIGGVGFSLDAPVTFKSGLISPVYCDNRIFPFWPGPWGKVIAGFEQMIGDENIPVDVFAGIEAAGIPHSAALGFATKLPSVFVRKQVKEHGTKRRVEGGDVAGKRVVLVEDLVTSGMSSLSGVQALRTEGGIVEDCLAIVSYQLPEVEAKFIEAGVRLHVLTTFAEVLDVATSKGLLTAEQVSSVREWLENPHEWTKRNGW